MNLNNYLRKGDSEAQKVSRYMQSYQFKLSQEILGERIEKELSKEQAAEISNLSISEYKNFERGIISYSEKEYKNVVGLLKSFVPIDLELQILHFNRVVETSSERAMWIHDEGKMIDFTPKNDMVTISDRKENNKYEDCSYENECTYQFSFV